jgi:type I restriction enzyme S subunit
MPKDSKYFLTKGPYKGYPRDWKVIELGDLLNRVRLPVEVIPDHEYQEIGIRSHGKGLFHKEPVKGSDLGNKSVFWVEMDCLIINIVFAWEQAVGITTDQEKGMIASHRFPMWQSKGNIDLHYLLKIFLTPFGRHLLELASPGGAGRNRTLGQDDFNKTPVCIPSNIKEQQKIVTILSTWDKAIELEERLISGKKQQKKWLMQNLLTGKTRLHGFNGSWREVSLGGIGDTYTGLSGKNKDDFGYGKYYIPYTNVFENIIIDISKLEYVSVSEGEKQNKVRYGDILFTTSSETPDEVGMSSVYLNNIDDIYLNSFCVGFRLKDFNTLLPEFACYYFRGSNLRSILNVLAQGATRYNLSRSSLIKICIKLPTISEQTAIAEILSTADREIELHEKQLDELKKQKKVLTQLLLTGAVRVNTQEVS